MAEISKKKQGSVAASEWCRAADPAEIVRVAGYDFDFRLDTLDLMRKQGLNVPSSSDDYFSLGFWKGVKSYAVHKVWKARKESDRSKFHSTY